MIRGGVKKEKLLATMAALRGQPGVHVSAT